MINDISLQDKIIQVLLALAPHTTIAHHLPGRIRLKVSLSGVGSLQKTDLGNLVKQIPGILNVRINPAALSAIVEYDPRRLDPELWENLSGRRNQAKQAQEIANRLRSLWEQGGKAHGMTGDKGG